MRKAAQKGGFLHARQQRVLVEDSSHGVVGSQGDRAAVGAFRRDRAGVRAVVGPSAEGSGVGWCGQGDCRAYRIGSRTY